jgi:hypothetical protein
METDDLSLLASMSAKERRKLRTKGIFTVTQLSYTFRPRRRPKRLRDKREKYHHSLKALAIREKKIHIVGRRIVLKRKAGYVWVLATLHEVAYFYAETREGELLHKLLEGFQGVLISNFYAAYDSIPATKMPPSLNARSQRRGLGAALR